jgi:hypothetical protein
MRALKTGLGLTSAIIALIALPSAAAAEYLIPPANSAVNQYTETFPTAGGDRDAEKGQGKHRRSPTQVLGRDNAHRLQAQGPDGRAAAQLASATAPPQAGGHPAGGGGGKGGGSGAGSGQLSGSGGGGPPHSGDGGQTKGANGAQSLPSGSSGFGEVIAQATGSSSSGQLGLLLPLIIAAAIAWSVAFLLRQRKRPTA